MVIKGIEKRAKELWEYTYSLPPLKPKFTLFCIVCKIVRGESVPLLFKEFYPHKRPYPSPGEEGVNPYRIDMGYKCPKCGWVTYFGVPVEKGYFEWVCNEVKKRFGGVRVVTAVDLQFS